MKDPRTRLDRPVIGDRVHRPRPVVDEVGSRLDATPREENPWLGKHLTVRKVKEGRKAKVRNSQNRVRIDHHAPQLVRLVRHPYAMHGTSMRKQPGTSRKREAPVARENYRKVLDAALAIDRSVTVLRPTSVHLRPEPRPRLDAGEFIAQREGEGT